MRRGKMNRTVFIKCLSLIVIMSGVGMAADMGAQNPQKPLTKKTMQPQNPQQPAARVAPQRPQQPAPHMTQQQPPQQQAPEKKKGFFSQMASSVKKGTQKATTAVKSQFQSKCPAGFVPQTPEEKAACRSNVGQLMHQTKTAVKSQFQSKCPDGHIPATKEEAVACQSNARRMMGAVNKYVMPSKPTNPNETPEERAERIANENPMQQATRQMREQAMVAGAQIATAASTAVTAKTQQLANKATTAVTKKLNKMVPQQQQPVQMPEEQFEPAMEQEQMNDPMAEGMAEGMEQADQSHEQTEEAMMGQEPMVEEGEQAGIPEAEEEHSNVEDPMHQAARQMQQAAHQIRGNAMMAGAQMATTASDVFAAKSQQLANKATKAMTKEFRKMAPQNQPDQMDEPGVEQGQMPVDDQGDQEIMARHDDPVPQQGHVGASNQKLRQQQLLKKQIEQEQMRLQKLMEQYNGLNNQ